MIKFGRSKNPRNSAVQRGDHGLVEPSEVRFRKWAITLMLVLTPPILFLIYYKAVFPGLTHPDAMEYAQIARNIHEGQGITTKVLRPLALTHGNDPMRQPDLTHQPLFPILTAIAFGI